MEIDPNLSYEDIKLLTPKERADLLCGNPVAALNAFRRRIQSIFDNFLFGKTNPFGSIKAYLGRIEQQNRLSPHLHLLIWTHEKAPKLKSQEGDIVENSSDILKFIEMFTSAILPEEKLTPLDSLPEPRLEFPLKYHEPRTPNLTVHPFSKEKRYNILSNLVDQSIFNGSPEKNLKIRNLNICTQFHICNSYCSKGGSNCRFLFAFDLNPRASILEHTINDRTRFLAQPPRNHMQINQTHPLLMVMAQANTDVSVVLGNSIAESMYVCGYAVKSEKDRIFDTRSVNALLKYSEVEEDNVKLLGKIGRNCMSAREIGAQEAVDYLLGNSIVYQSTNIKNLDLDFLYTIPNGLDEEEREKLFGFEIQKDTDTQISDFLDSDELLSTSKTRKRAYLKSLASDCPIEISHYMQRPLGLENISFNNFFIDYEIKKLPSKLNSKNIISENDLLLSNKDDNDKFYIKIRKKKNGIVPIIPNIPKKNPVNDKSPRFAAAALILHVPFRTFEQLTKFGTFVLTCQKYIEMKSFPDLNEYYDRNIEMSSSHGNISKNKENSLPKNEEKYNSENDDTGTDFLSSDESSEGEREEKIDSCQTVKLELIDIYKIKKIWHQKENQMKYNFLNIKDYLKACKSFGIFHANKLLEKRDNNEQIKSQVLFENTETSNLNFSKFQMKEIIEKIVSKAMTSCQKLWLKKVLSYLAIYYNLTNSNTPKRLIEICARNPPILTNAPGGCGKSWLLSQVEQFVKNYINPIKCPIWDNHTNNYYISENNGNECEFGRFGRVATFAPSGVAAGNSNGYTFHNGLRSSKITINQILQEPSEKTINQLIKDFHGVSAVFIDEFSMTSLVLFSYLDKILRKIRPFYCEYFFWGSTNDNHWRCSSVAIYS